MIWLYDYNKPLDGSTIMFKTQEQPDKDVENQINMCISHLLQTVSKINVQVEKFFTNINL